LEIRRSVGKIVNLEQILQEKPLCGKVGIAHTRWATHGKPSEKNAHPHSDSSGALVVVHNGIIENYLPLKASLQADGYRFRSDTDTEVIAYLIEKYLRLGSDFAAAVQTALTKLKGSYAVAIMSQSAPNTVLAARNGGAPLVIGSKSDEFFVASDIPAILSYTRDIMILDDREIAILSPNKVRVCTFDGLPLHKPTTTIQWDAAAAEKNGYPHFMLKEIYEQPKAIADTCRGRVDLETGQVLLPELALTPQDLARIQRISLVACGTSWHAALIGEYMLEALCHLPVEVDIGSEFRYREPILNDDTTLTIAISQSGETVDTLGALRTARTNRSTVVSICNVVGSSISRESDGVIYTHAGPEIGVASTKAFTTQLVALYLFAIHLGQARGTLSPQQGAMALKELLGIPRLAEKVLTHNPYIKELAQRFYRYTDFLYLGRGIHYPLALEGALKLKEISYIHAEGYPAGEMKHGPIALIDRNMPVVMLAPRDRLYEKICSNIEEVKAREGIVIALASEGDKELAAKVDHMLTLPCTSEWLFPILAVIPLQLLAYHIAVFRNCDVDQPRNLAKSVTVE
jgi:glucosamine--fructose-6-phosphate aminotransferase (isomerizing)